ncbi:calcium-binding protein [Benzoatithermus flavus]|uniref:Calcium-binding protein n=1 Tax=Benzoatithermus flavus TaxID=3108223 RepID=A0ABU8XNL6_9PROT
MVIKRGTNGSDWLIGTNADDRLYGLGGDDFLQGSHGNDVLDGGPGSDTASWADAVRHGSKGFYYGVGVDLARGIADALEPGYRPAPSLEHDRVSGIENVIGSPYIDHIIGSAGPNVLWGQQGGDWLEGGAGNDVLHGGQGADNLYGGDGDDRLLGDQDGDFLYGGEGADLLYGDAGDDWLAGNEGNDELHGGAGNDRLLGSARLDGSDLLDGGDGVDIADYSDSGVGIRADLAAGRVTARGETDRLVAVEGIVGSDHADLIRGDARANELTGGLGNDRIWGGAGNDHIDDASRFHPAEQNRLDGGPGDDWVYGGDGSDRIYGGPGADRLSGGTRDSLTGSADLDRIDLGADNVRDTVVFELFDGRPFMGSFGIDTLVHFDGRRDVLSFFVGQERYGGQGYVVDVGDFLDSDDNGVINGADRDVAVVGRNLVLDIGAVWEHAMGRPLPGGQPQQVVLEGLTQGFAVSLVDSQLDTHHGYTVLTQDFVL